MRSEEKVQGGKLVCVEVWAEAGSGKVARVKITGDFFLHPEERIEALESALEGVPLAKNETPLKMSESELAELLRKALGEGILIGASCEDLARIFAKAVRG